MRGKLKKIKITKKRKENKNIQRTTIYEQSTSKNNYRSTKITEHQKKKINIQRKESNEKKTPENQKEKKNA